MLQNAGPDAGREPDALSRVGEETKETDMEIVTTGIGGTIVLALDIFAIYNILTSGSGAGAKILWTILVLLLPILGFIIWLIAGPRSRTAMG